MNETILNADGTVTVVGDAGSVSGILMDIVDYNTVPGFYDDDTGETTAPLIPTITTLAVEVTREEIKTHAWRLPKAREEAMERIRGIRNGKLEANDKENAGRGLSRPDSRNQVAIAQHSQRLRDLSVAAQAALDAMVNTDDMDAYAPDYT
ncbi:MAG: hypothetical protein ABGX63_05790 [bacterium]